MEEQRSKLKTSKPKLNCSSKKPAKDRDHERLYKVNIHERTSSFKCSTPIERVTSVRKSLLKIKVNTVAGIVNLFNQSKKSISMVESPINEKSINKSEVTRKESHNESESNSRQIDNYITYYNELSSIKHTSDSDSKMDSEENMELDFGSNESTIRRRSQSCNAATIRKPVNILESYKKYPNFKLKYFKYFGVDSREYLSSHGVDITNITDLSFPSDQNVRVNNSDHVRKRSKSFSGKNLSEPMKTTAKYQNYPNFKPSYLKYFGVGLTNGIDKPETFSSQKLILKEIAENSTIDRKRKFLHTTANRRSKSPKMEALETVPEEPQVKMPPMIKKKHEMKKLPEGHLESEYIAEVKARLRQSINAPTYNLENHTVDYPQLASALEIDQISALHMSDAQKVKDLTKLSAKKANMDCVKKGLKNCNKLLGSKFNVEKKERK